jgi:hypothetical protein
MQMGTVRTLEKLLFWIFLIISVLLAVKLGRIFLFEYAQLSTYGIGYLTGLSIALFILTVLTILFGMRIFKKAE